MRLPLWLADLRDVFARGWLLVIGGGLIALIDAGRDAVPYVYSHHHWHWPAWWWLLPLLAAVLVAQQLVIKDRRGNRGGSSAQDLVKTAIEKLSQHGLPVGQSVAWHVTQSPEGKVEVDLRTQAAQSGLPPTSEVPRPSEYVVESPPKVERVTSRLPLTRETEHEERKKKRPGPRRRKLP